MIESLFWGSLLRFYQVFVYSTLWVVMGFFIAGVFQAFVGPQRTRELFGTDSAGWKGIVYGWLWGMLLPVCSLGAIPIVLQLYRSGVRGGTLIAFALTVPLFNPLSILYGLTLSDPIAIISFAFCSLLIVTLVGLIWDFLFPGRSSDSLPDVPPIEYGAKRIVGMLDAATGMLFGPAGWLILIGMLGSVLVSLMLPHGSMSNALERDNWLAPLSVAFLGIPIYSTPLLAMSQIGSMFQHGNSIGAAFSLLIFGAGVNLGLLICFLRIFGWKQVLTFFLLLLIIALSLAYLISEPLFPTGVTIAGHTHAFDVYTNPFTSDRDLYRATMAEMRNHWLQNEMGGTTVLISFALLGLIFQRLRRKINLEAWVLSRSETDRRNDIVLPDWLMKWVAILGLLVLSVFGCYVYYPDPNECLEQMRHINLDVQEARMGRWEPARRGIELQESWSRLLEVGTFIRTGKLSDYQRMKARILRDKLDLLKHSVEDEDTQQAKKYAMQAEQAFHRLARAFRSDGQ
jgi:uncharacterized membrane protein YraQ (UPF0718 family)